MAEVDFNGDKERGWVYAGRRSNGEVRFKKYTNQTLEHVKGYLDERSIAYLVYPRQCLLFIYKEKEPASKYSPRYSYYYTTGRWGSDKRTKHYHSDGIEHFISKYYRTVEEDKAFWESKKEEVKGEQNDQG